MSRGDSHRKQALRDTAASEVQVCRSDALVRDSPDSDSHRVLPGSHSSVKANQSTTQK